MTDSKSATHLAETPMMRQYLALKATQPDAILFFRLGDFYEMFLDDAKIAAKELELTLTGRGKDENRIPMCGFPHHSAENHIPRLIAKGYKVAICEQTEDPALAKGLTKREIVRIITPGTVTAGQWLEEKDNNYIAAVHALSDTQSALAFADSSTGEFVLGILDTGALPTHLERLSVKEVLAETDTQLGDTLLTTTTFTTAAEAKRKLETHFAIQDVAAFGLDSLNAALPAAWALLDYLKQTQKDAVAQITRLQPLGVTAALAMDRVTIKNLELTENAQPGLTKTKTEGTLFEVLDFTKTAMGARKLKHWLKAPLLDETAMNTRLDAVASLKEDLLSREEIRDCLSAVYDLERLLTRLVSRYNNPRDVIALKQSLEAILPLGSILAHLSGSLLTDMTAFFAPLSDPDNPIQTLIRLIETAIVDEPPVSTKDGGVIRPGFSEELDVLVLSFKNIRQWIGALEETERARTGIKSLKVGFNKVFGYYIEVSNSNAAQVPDNYIRKQTLTGGERFITPELKEKETVLLHGEEKQKQLEQQLFDTLIATLAEHTRDLQTLADTLATLDVLQSLATAAQKNNYARPQFAPQPQQAFTMVNGRHPVLEKRPGITFIPNSLTLSKTQNRFVLLTGPNMAGKSTVMRQVALLVVMAQMGSFVPADALTLSPADKLFTRIGALDNLFFGQSTFMVEMLETASILNNATENSLVILDEIGRGTATYDGMSIAAAVSEFLIADTQCRTLFATHYHELTILEKQFSAFANFSMKITEDGHSIVFEHRLIPGPADKSYGLHVAQMAGLPNKVLQKAATLLKTYEETSLNKHNHQQLSLF
ncbi:MAG: DNA mismatch repair protein MutS [Candidatus Margulisiibacteriota bacterium]